MGLEHLKLFFHFGNVSGLFPFRMVLDESTGKFKRFDIRWRHPANWWFLFLLIGNLILLALVIYSMWSMIIETTKSLPTTFSVVLLLYSIGFFILCTTPRLFFIRFRNFDRALEMLRQIDRVLDKIPTKIPCTTQRRTVIGIIVSLISVCLELINSFINHFSPDFRAFLRSLQLLLL